MRVSLIVPVRNEAENIRATLLGVAAQDFPVAEYEILVVDGMSDDDTPRIVRELQRTIPNLSLFENPKRLASAARNIGVRNASGEFIAIVDGHCKIDDPRFLTHLVEAFESSGADTLGRPQPLRADQPTAFQQAVSAARESWLGHNPDSAIFSNVARFVPADNVAVAYRRDVFDLMGLFDESFDACEDVEFNTRVRQVGLSCYFTPTIAVDYQPRASLGGLFYQMGRYGRGRAKLGWKHPASVTIPSLVPPMWLLWFIGASMIGLFLAPIALALAASVAIYLFVLLAESLRLSRATQTPIRKLPLVFAAIHVGFAWGYLSQALSIWPTAMLRLLPIRRSARV